MRDDSFMVLLQFLKFTLKTEFKWTGFNPAFVT